MRAVKSVWKYVWGTSKPQQEKKVEAPETNVTTSPPSKAIPVSLETDKLFADIPTFKIVVVGDGQVGKTSYVKMLSSGGCVDDFNPAYKATFGVDVTPVRFTTNKGIVIVNFWDCAGQEQFSGLKDRYYIGAHGFIMMCSMDSVISFKNLPKWLRLIRQSAVYDENIAIVATKLDMTSASLSTLPSKIHDIPTFEVSSKQTYPSNKYPIQFLLQNIMKDTNITIL